MPASDKHSDGLLKAATENPAMREGIKLMVTAVTGIPPEMVEMGLQAFEQMQGQKEEGQGEEGQNAPTINTSIGLDKDEEKSSSAPTLTPFK